MTLNQILFIPLFVAAIGLFFFSCYQRLQLVALGQPENRLERPAERLAGALAYAFGQKRVLRRPFGLNHSLLFWGFLLLLLANGEFLIQGLFPGVSLALLPAAVFQRLAWVFDLASVVALVCALAALIRRVFFPPAYLGSEEVPARSGEALLILGMIAFLMIAFFTLHGARIALGAVEPFRPVSTLVGGVLSRFSRSALGTLITASWWSHAVVLLVFLNLLPRTKHTHILTAIPNTFFRRLEKTQTLPREIFEKGRRFGVGEVAGFSWKDLFDSLTCTECGRCQDLCPAHNTGKPLNPRQVVHDIKSNLLENGPRLKKGQPPRTPLIGDGQGGGSQLEEALWSCTTCGACLSVCPVLIEQMPKIVKMRRYLVQEKARFPEELLTFFENMEQRSNPWGIAPAERTKWCSQLEVKPFVSGETDTLFFVGCAGAFDTRSKQVSLALASVLDAAGVSWGILGKDEPCCGDSLRRLGNEFVFDRMAQQNVALFKEKGVKRIVTACPHCFTTLNTDYRQFGLKARVIHHSQLIQELLREGRLKLPKASTHGRLLFHDSCYLGRHNGIYEAPREVLRKATGWRPQEFDRHGENGFCCGAGGGRMWMEERTRTRINQERIKQALALQPDTLCVSCPYCLTMMEDGLKDEGNSHVRVKDLAEIVAEAWR